MWSLIKLFKTGSDARDIRCREDTGGSECRVMQLGVGRGTACRSRPGKGCTYCIGGHIANSFADHRGHNITGCYGEKETGDRTELLRDLSGSCGVWSVAKASEGETPMSHVKEDLVGIGHAQDCTGEETIAIP